MTGEIQPKKKKKVVPPPGRFLKAEKAANKKGREQKY